MIKKLVILFLISTLLGCEVIEDDTMISFKGQLINRNGSPIENIKIELVSTSITEQEQLEISDIDPSRLDKLEVFDLSDEEGKFQFFFPRSNLDLAIYIGEEQDFKFYLDEFQDSFSLFLVEDSDALDSDFGMLTLIPSE